MIKRIAYLPLLFPLSISSCHFSPTVPQSCEPWAEMRMGKYLLTNNTWGSAGQKDFKQCIAIDEKRIGQPNFRWQWRWAGDNGRVLAYPSLLFGHKPWNETSTTTMLPMKIDTVKKITIHYDIEQKGIGSHNVLLEAWLTSIEKPSPTNRTAEIAIHLAQQNWPGMPGSRIKTVSIDSELYDFYVDPAIKVLGDDLRWPYLGFVYKGHRVTHGEIDLAAFVHFLQEEGYIQATHYLASIELGSELVAGKGEAVIREFRVEF